MPYIWVDTDQTAPAHAGAVSGSSRPKPEFHLHLWPHRSLPVIGFVWFIGITSALLALPLIGLLGSPALWGLLPFLLAAIAGIWWALQRSYRDGEITEDLRLWQDHLSLIRHGPRNKTLEWSANPYWVTTTLHATGGPLPNYLTLRGGDREVELGAFLSGDERIALRREMDRALDRLKMPQP